MANGTTITDILRRILDRERRDQRATDQAPIAVGGPESRAMSRLEDAALRTARRAALGVRPSPLRGSRRVGFGSAARASSQVLAERRQRVVTGRERRLLERPASGDSQAQADQVQALQDLLASPGLPDDIKADIRKELRGLGIREQPAAPPSTAPPTNGAATGGAPKVLPSPLLENLLKPPTGIEDPRFRDLPFAQRVVGQAGEERGVDRAPSFEETRLRGRAIDVEVQRGLDVEGPRERIQRFDLEAYVESLPLDTDPRFLTGETRRLFEARRDKAQTDPQRSPLTLSIRKVQLDEETRKNLAEFAQSFLGKRTDKELEELAEHPLFRLFDAYTEAVGGPAIEVGKQAFGGGPTREGQETFRTLNAFFKPTDDPSRITAAEAGKRLAETFRKRPLSEQLIAGIISDPFLVAGVVKGAPRLASMLARLGEAARGTAQRTLAGGLARVGQPEAALRVAGIPKVAGAAPELPRTLAGAKPRYNVGQTSYTPQFESDIDKALFVVAQTKKSRMDAAYMTWLKSQFPGVEESAIREAGGRVRAFIKTTVRGQPEGAIAIPSSGIAESLGGRVPAAPVAQAATQKPRVRLTVAQQEQQGGLGAQGVERRRVPAPGQPPQPVPASKVVRAQPLDDITKNLVDEDTFVATGAPDGPKQPPPPLGAKGPPDKPEDILREIVNLQTLEEKERPILTLLRRHQGALSAAENEARIYLQDGNSKLRALGIGGIRKGRLVPKEADVTALDDLFDALHNPSKITSGEMSLDARFTEVYDDLRNLTDWEEAMRIDFDPQMATVEDYFYRGWKVPKNFDVGQPVVRGQLGTRPVFRKLRVNATYREMREAGFEPLFWNPYEQWQVSRKQGVRYREQIQLVSWLKKLEIAQPVGHSTLPEGWRVPKIGPAFEGKPFATTAADGTPVPMFTRRYAVTDDVARRLENIYGVRPDLGKIRVGGKEIDVLSVVDAAVFIPKRAKLMGSFFQQVDFLTRSGVGSWHGMVDALQAGQPIEAVRRLALYPKSAAEILQSYFSPAKRESLRRVLNSTTPLVKGRPDVHMRGIVEAGLSTIDVTIVPGDIDRTARLIAKEHGLGKLKVIQRALGSFESATRRALFEGPYPAAQVTDIKNNIAPMFARQFPSATDAQLNGMIARFTNIRYSTIPTSQSVFQNRFMREILTRTFFSIGESEALLRQAVGVLKGPYKQLWSKHYIGAYLFLIATANAIHFASTGQFLPASRYSPINKDRWGPLPVGYNTNFAAPTLPIKGRGETEVTLDLVGQLDTALRILDPVSFLGARESVPIRALANQASGEDFFGAPIDDVGPGGVVSRTSQAVIDLFSPIGPGQTAVELARERSGFLRDIIPPGEGRLGVPGLAIQATGVNLRTESTPQLLDRMARESGYTNQLTGELVTKWDELAPSQKRTLGRQEPYKSELDRRTTVGAERGSEFAQRRITAKAITDQFEANQLADDGELGQYDDSSQRWLGSMGVTQWKANRRRRQDELNGRRDQLYSGLDTRQPKTPTDFYYAKIDELEELHNGLMTDDAWDELEFWLAALPDKEQKFIEENTRLGNYTPRVKEYFEALDTLRPYWEVDQAILNTIPDERTRRLWESYLTLESRAQTSMRQAFPEIKTLAQQVTAQRKLLRQIRSEIDGSLVKWYGYTPIKGR